ncbi:MAG: GNAT family N-acetyltransferase [Planctomycetota bacterium]
MYRLRPFLNSDPPHLAAIWRSQPPQRGLLQPVTPPLLEYAVFSKAHFDRNGLIVATKDGKPVGFAHAGFGPNEDGSAIDCSLGTTYMLMVDPAEGGGLADELLHASEAYLRSRGATVLYAGGIRPLNSFYLGLYGGSEIPGVLQSNETLHGACQRSGYDESARVCILQCDLARFKAPVSRGARLLKRSTNVVEKLDPPAGNWWEACVWGGLQQDRFEMVQRRTGEPVANAGLWDVQPLSSSWGICTAGLHEIEVRPEFRRQGYGSYLLSEAFKALRRRGVITVEAQTMSTNEAAQAFYKRLGFTEVDHGLVYRKRALAELETGSHDGIAAVADA